MIRAIGGVLLGYLTMFALIFGSFSLLYFALGADGAFRPGSYDVSTAWLVASIALSLAAAYFGGRVCATFGRSDLAPKILAGLVFVLGVATALMSPAPSEAPAVRDAGVGNMEAMMKAVSPTWMNWLNPVLGVAGVFAGAKRKAAAAS